eukprot:CAMPEP_0113677402 /NCGR_PEP_ID=MMETSP0038_2-20120614/9241_1 /TAXON_ID=2898 /ORGANISM="Cryptomonas paramecium" /LENGTH=67 /DNA_ID=CAMNT_0000594663 /DNA_START=149 /DNA_END=352 /DNA_ORIENTATION=- /assembly_acc=CAM_ASM_000170
MQSTAASSIAAAARPSAALYDLAHEADFDLHLDSVFDAMAGFDPMPEGMLAPLGSVRPRLNKIKEAC